MRHPVTTLPWQHATDHPLKGRTVLFSSLRAEVEVIDWVSRTEQADWKGLALAGDRRAVACAARIVERRLPDAADVVAVRGRRPGKPAEIWFVHDQELER